MSSSSLFPPAKEIVLTVLNGCSFAIIVSLIPAALLSQLLSALPQTAPVLAFTSMINLAQCSLALLAGCAIGYLLKLSLLQSGSIALACFVSAGNYQLTETGFIFNGPGVILNILIAALVATYCSIVCEKYFGALKLVFSSTVVLLVGGGIGFLSLPYTKAVQHVVGQATAMATDFTPLTMGIVLGIIFSILVVSPLSSVGVAMSIGLAGIGSAAANAGICAGAFTLALISWKVNPFGISIAHFVGSPKIQMANMLSKLQSFIPVIFAAAISGACSALLELHGTPFSAGFGFSGLLGPLTAFQTSPGEMLALRVILGFVVIPVSCAFIAQFIFVKKLKLISAEDLIIKQQ